MGRSRILGYVGCAMYPPQCSDYAHIAIQTTRSRGAAQECTASAHTICWSPSMCVRDVIVCNVDVVVAYCEPKRGRVCGRNGSQASSVPLFAVGFCAFVTFDAVDTFPLTLFNRSRILIKSKQHNTHPVARPRNRISERERQHPRRCRAIRRC